MQVPTRTAAGRHGVSPRARHRVVADAWLGARGPDQSGAAPTLDRATLQLAAAAAHGAGYFAAVDADVARGLLAAARPRHAAARHHPLLIAPDDHARYGGGPYADDDPADDHYWAAVELWLATGHERLPATTS